MWFWITLSLVILSLVGFTLFVSSTYSNSPARRRLFAYAERQVYVETSPKKSIPDGGQQTPLQEPTPGHIELPYLLAGCMLTVLLGLILAPTIDLRALFDLNSGGAIPFQLGSSLLLLSSVGASIIVHFRPNHSRQLKYSLVLAGCLLLPLFLMPRIILDALERGSVKVALPYFTEMYPVFLVAIMAVLGGTWIRRQVSTVQKIPRAWEQFLFTLVHVPAAGPLILILFLFGKDLMLVLLMIRYLSGERFRRQPVIYLGSFHYDAAAKVFGEAVAPALAPFAVIKGLVHSKQTGGALFSRTSIWQFGLMATVPDAHWKDWVAKALSSASLVIIDRSVQTESVMWEVATALHFVDQRRVVIISSDQEPINNTSDVEVIKYGHGPEMITRLRRDIGSWAETTLPTGRSKRVFVTVVLICATLLAYILEVAASVIFSW